MKRYRVNPCNELQEMTQSMTSDSRDSPPKPTPCTSGAVLEPGGTEAAAVIRYLLVAVAAGLNMAIGFVFHPGANAYLVIGMPITVLFQVFVARRPLRELWFIMGQEMKWDRWTSLLFVLFLIGPGQAIVSGFRNGSWAVTVYGIAAIAGAAGASLAFRVLDRANLLRLGLLLVVIIPAGAVRLIINTAAGGHGSGNLEILARLSTALQSLLFYIPAVFVAEEVFFRGALDSYLHRREKGMGWFSAAYISVLWGLWHLPIVHPLTRLTVAVIICVQLILGLALSWLWRRTGNMAMNGTFHAFIDALRNAIAF